MLEVHDPGSFQIAKDTAGSHGERFHGIWMSGLTQTTHLGFPETELISPMKRASMLSWLSDCEHKRGYVPLCIAFDCDSGGNVTEARNAVSLPAELGVSMIMIEDKIVEEAGAKINSLNAASNSQRQADMYEFANILRVFTTAASNAEGERQMLSNVDHSSYRKLHRARSQERSRCG